jgi:hypothetical protein
LTALLRLWRTPKRQQPRLVWVQGQSKAPQAFLKHRHHAASIVLVFKTDDEIVAVSDQSCLPPKSRRHLGFKPQVEHIMEIDVT